MAVLNSSLGVAAISKGLSHWDRNKCLIINELERLEATWRAPLAFKVLSLAADTTPLSGRSCTSGKARVDVSDWRAEGPSENRFTRRVRHYSDCAGPHSGNGHSVSA